MNTLQLQHCIKQLINVKYPEINVTVLSCDLALQYVLRLSKMMMMTTTMMMMKKKKKSSSSSSKNYFTSSSSSELLGTTTTTTNNNNNNNIHCLTINLDTSTNPGSHWICLLIDTNKNIIELFDSLAIHDFYPEHVIKLINVLVDDDGKLFNNKFKTNLKNRFQSLTTNCCGHYCALFFYHRIILKHDFETFCNLLKSKFPSFCARDCVVYETVYKLLQNQAPSPYIPDNPSEECNCIQICKKNNGHLTNKYD